MLRKGLEPAVVAVAALMKESPFKKCSKLVSAVARPLPIDENRQQHKSTSVSGEFSCSREMLASHNTAFNRSHRIQSNFYEPKPVTIHSFSTQSSTSSQNENTPDTRKTYLGLSLAHASLATTAFVVPGTVANALFPGRL